MKKTTALPIYVSDSKELIDEKGRYVGRCVLSVTVRGNCVPKVYSGKDSVYPPNARGGEIRFVRYLEEADVSIVE